eukprot:126524-Chlamydomonas_euryale.AAC.3
MWKAAPGTSRVRWAPLGGSDSRRGPPFLLRLARRKAGRVFLPRRAFPPGCVKGRLPTPPSRRSACRASAAGTAGAAGGFRPERVHLGRRRSRSERRHDKHQRTWQAPSLPRRPHPPSPPPSRRGATRATGACCCSTASASAASAVSAWACASAIVASRRPARPRSRSLATTQGDEGVAGAISVGRDALDAPGCPPQGPAGE